MSSEVPMSLLDVRDCTIRFGGLTALSHLSFSVEEQELLSVIGPNGAGKTTLFNLITGVYRPTTGAIFLGGRVLSGRKPHQVARLGVGRTFQNIRLFKEMTVADNVRAAHAHRTRHGLWSSLFATAASQSEAAETGERCLKLLDLFGLSARAEERASNLSYGDQRRLEIARALATEPRLLLLDEPTAGMNPQETSQLMELIRWIWREFKLTILLIEHDMKVVMGLSPRILVLDNGEQIAEGTPAEIRGNRKVIEAYLGEAQQAPSSLASQPSSSSDGARPDA